MSVSDLQKLGLLRPESEWDPKHTRSFVPRLLWMCLVTLGIGGCVMLTLGDGGAVSWIGLLIFLVSLFFFVLLNMRSVNTALRNESGPDSDE
jgi:amino acid transporter